MSAMCGIAGVWGRADGSLAERLRATIAHRGPDGVGLQQRPIGTLAHCRLAIMDPVGGVQPIVNEDR
jgi:asparagine synthase (glutamine-hydrolysing)